MVKSGSKTAEDIEYLYLNSQRNTKMSLLIV